MFCNSLNLLFLALRTALYVIIIPVCAEYKMICGGSALNNYCTQSLFLLGSHGISLGGKLGWSTFMIHVEEDWASRVGMVS